MRLISDGDPLLVASTDPAVGLGFVEQATGDAQSIACGARIAEIAVEVGGKVLADRATRPGHLTGSAFVISHDGSQAILLFHAKLQRWLQPGGHADGDMNLMAVALREATEETGIAGLGVHPVPIDLDIHEVAPPREDAHLHLDVRFVVVAPEGAEPAANHESEHIRWVSRDELVDFDPDAGLERLAARAFGWFDQMVDAGTRPDAGSRPSG